MALRFKAMGEPMRLRILERLFRSPASVSVILETTGGSQANVSKHLAVLRSGGLVRRRKEGNRTVYWIADTSIERICSVVCEAVGREAQEDAKALATLAPRKRARA